MSLSSTLLAVSNNVGAYANAMNVVSNDIANLNTIGFKGSTVEFANLVVTSPTSIDKSGGQGVYLSAVNQEFSQGTLLSTGNATDLAIQGNGFFMVSGPYQGNDGNYYTRSGQFFIDKTGTLVNGDGLVVQGYQADIYGNISETIGNLVLAATPITPPNLSSQVTVAANLNSNNTQPASFSLLSPAATSNFSTSTVLYDSRGAAHNIDLYFCYLGNNQYSWHALANGAEITGGTAGTPVSCANGTLTFASNGTLTSQTTVASSFSFVNATANQSVVFDFGDPTSTGGTGLAGITSYAGANTLSTIFQDGFSEGSLAGISVNNDGTVLGTFSNGAKRNLGQLVMASFANQSGLVSVGDSLYTTSEASGQAAVGAPGSSGRGSLIANSLEQSNVDISKEFIEMMIYQQSFNANTRCATVANEMLQQLLALGR